MDRLTETAKTIIGLDKIRQSELWGRRAVFFKRSSDDYMEVVSPELLRFEDHLKAEGMSVSFCSFRPANKTAFRAGLAIEYPILQHNVLCIVYDSKAATLVFEETISEQRRVFRTIPERNFDAVTPADVYDLIETFMRRVLAKHAR